MRVLSPILLATLLAASVAVSAQTQPQLASNSQQFADAKQNLLDRLSKVVSCVNAAKTYDAMEVCRAVPPHGGAGTQHQGEEGDHAPMATKP
jgi:hypothetical protein